MLERITRNEYCFLHSVFCIMYSVFGIDEEYLVNNTLLGILENTLCQRVNNLGADENENEMKNSRNGNKDSGRLLPLKVARLVILTASMLTLFLLAQVLVNYGLHSFLAETPSLQLKNHSEKSTIEHNNNNNNNNNFERILWPRLQEKLCPGGLPNLRLGPTLFRLALEEFGPNVTKTKRSGVPFGFFSSDNGSSLVVDGNHPSDSLLYIKIWKSANNQIRVYLESKFNQNPDRNQKQEFSTPNNNNNNNNDAPETANYTFLEFNDDSGMSKFITNKPFFRYRNTNHNRPCVFTVIRDPISHFLSGYNEIEYRFLSSKQVDLPAAARRKQKPSYTTNVPLESGGGSSLEQEEDSSDSKILREARFESFVRTLVTNYRSMNHWSNHHVFPQSRILHPLKRLNLLPTMGDSPQTIWILPSIANLTETLPLFLAERCPRFVANYRNQQPPPTTPSGLPLFQTSSKAAHNSSMDPYQTYKAAKDVWNKGGHVARSVCHLHAFDYGCFYGDAVPSGTTLRASDIPRICKRVYASDSFQTTILV